MKFVAIITARGGSKGLPGKNIRPLAGKPMIAYSIEAALNSGVCDACFVTTEDPAIKAVSLRFGAEVIDRPSALATDGATSDAVVVHALGELERRGLKPEAFILLQPTSPLRTAEHIRAAAQILATEKVGSVVGVTTVEHHPYKDFVVRGDILEPLFDWKSLGLPRQSLPEVFRQNGAIYAVRTVDFVRECTFFVAPVSAFRMTAESSVDVDTAFDFETCERILEVKNG